MNSSAITPITTTITNNTYTTTSNGFGYNSISTIVPGFSTGYYPTLNPSPVVSISSMHLLAIYKPNTNELVVKINNDGSVVWTNNEMNIDEAVKSLSTALTRSAELVAGVTEGTRMRMRDLVFEELIEIAKLKGSLDSEDLILLLRSAKIVDKLKGVI